MLNSMLPRGPPSQCDAEETLLQVWATKQEGPEGSKKKPALSSPGITCATWNCGNQVEHLISDS